MLATTAVMIWSTGRIEHRFRVHVLSSLVDAIVVWSAIFLLGEHAVGTAQGAPIYIFAPRGWGIVADAFIHIVVISFFFLLYTVPSYLARVWLGWLLRALMFGIFVVFLTYRIMTMVVAVAETADHKTVFYPHAPLQPRVYDPPPNVSYKRNSVVAQLSFFTNPVDDLNTLPVYWCDERGNSDLEAFAKHLNVMERRQ